MTVAPAPPNRPTALRTFTTVLPRAGVVLIGTTASVRALAGNLAAYADGVIPAGSVLVNILPTAHDARALGIMPPVLGHIDELITLHARYRFQAAVLSMPCAMNADARRITALLAQLGVRTLTIPTFEDLLSGRAAGATPGAGQAKLDVPGLIGRTHWGVDKAAVGRIIKAKRVLITGAGGSIGSELARVCAGFSPAHVTLMERSENALFEIDQQMGRRFPTVQRSAVLHDVVDADATRRTLERLRPDVVFHAAAHKHVPLMEDHPSHAVNNNLFGTASIADACVHAGVERFVMISSEKAVNPTSVMGATKRLAEMYVQGLAANATATTSKRPSGTHPGRTSPGPTSTCRMSMVRFGNVLASACSVIPIWSQQMAEGHPLTVTDPRMTRYFMTIPEAATLVVQAAALDQPQGLAPVYVLDMGEPISILEMAVRFLRQHGYEPAIDTRTLPGRSAADPLPEPIAALLSQGGTTTDDAPDAACYPIVFTGARPGEKLFEELAYSAEMLSPTAHPAIGQWQTAATPCVSQPHPASQPPSASILRAAFDHLRDPSSPKAAVVEAIRTAVPEMKRS